LVRGDNDAAEGIENHYMVLLLEWPGNAWLMPDLDCMYSIRGQENTAQGNWHDLPLSAPDSDSLGCFAKISSRVAAGGEQSSKKYGTRTAGKSPAAVVIEYRNTQEMRSASAANGRRDFTRAQVVVRKRGVKYELRTRKQLQRHAHQPGYPSNHLTIESWRNTTIE
jgi:hypothetical protein